MSVHTEADSASKLLHSAESECRLNLITVEKGTYTSVNRLQYWWPWCFWHAWMPGLIATWKFNLKAVRVISVLSRPVIDTMHSYFASIGYRRTLPIFEGPVLQWSRIAVRRSQNDWTPPPDWNTRASITSKSCISSVSGVSLRFKRRPSYKKRYDPRGVVMCAQ